MRKSALGGDYQRLTVINTLRQILCKFQKATCLNRVKRLSDNFFTAQPSLCSTALHSPFPPTLAALATAPRAGRRTFSQSGHEIDCSPAADSGSTPA